MTMTRLGSENPGSGCLELIKSEKHCHRGFKNITPDWGDNLFIAGYADRAMDVRRDFHLYFYNDRGVFRKTLHEKEKMKKALIAAGVAVIAVYLYRRQIKKALWAV